MQRSTSQVLQKMSYLNFQWLIFMYLYLTNLSVLVGCDVRSIFKRGLTGLGSEFCVFLTGCLTKAKELSLRYYLPLVGGRLIGFIPSPKVFVQCELKSASSRFWTRGSVSISKDNNYYATSTSVCRRRWRIFTWVSKVSTLFQFLEV